MTTRARIGVGALVVVVGLVIAALIVGQRSGGNTGGPPPAAPPTAAAVAPVSSASASSAGTPATPSLALEAVENARDALAASGLAPGRVFRSGRLCMATAEDKRAMAGLLAGGTVVDLRADDAVAECPDPELAGVTGQHHAVSADTIYERYVTEAERRAAFGAALADVERSVTAGGAAWVHCTAGRDRTGWTIAVLMAILGSSRADIEAEFLRTPSADVANLESAYAAVEAHYGEAVQGGVTGPGMYTYVRALGLTDADIASLRAALQP